MSDIPTLSPTEIVALLKQVPLFEGLADERAYHALAKLCTRHDFKAQELLLKQHARSHATHIIIAGVARVYRTRPDGSSTTLALLGKGEIVGELSLLDNGPITASVEALKPVQTLQIQHDDFLIFLKKYTLVSIKIIQVLVHRLRVTNQLIEERHVAKLTTRALNVLHNLAKLEDSQTVEISQDELAKLLGASRPRVTEALQELEKDGQISRKWRKITLMQEALKETVPALNTLLVTD